jgi:hypothetical protein
MFEPEEFAQPTAAVVATALKKIKIARPVYLISAKLQRDSRANKQIAFRPSQP